MLVDNDCGIDPDYIGFNCSIAYRGNVAPKMQLNMSSIGALDPVKVPDWRQPPVSYHSVVGTAKANQQMRDGQFVCEVMHSMVVKRPSCSSQKVSVMCEYVSAIEWIGSSA